jgi:hypothetical protein
MTLFNISWLLISTAILIGSIAYAVHHWRTTALLRQTGITVDGEVTKRGTDSWGRTLYYYVEYRFYVDNDESWGGSYSGRQSIGVTNYNRLKTGSLVSVNYLPSNPAISRLAAGDTDNSPRDTATIRAVMMAVLWILIVTKVFNL